MAELPSPYGTRTPEFEMSPVAIPRHHRDRARSPIGSTRATAAPPSRTVAAWSTWPTAATKSPTTRYVPCTPRTSATRCSSALRKSRRAARAVRPATSTGRRTGGRASTGPGGAIGVGGAESSCKSPLALAIGVQDPSPIHTRIGEDDLSRRLVAGVDGGLAASPPPSARCWPASRTSPAQTAPPPPT